jgi:S-adenosylmethionine:tRNA ribosyltransferase-isomerase
MKLSDFDYSYPEELVAQRPLPERDRSRMMVADRGAGSWAHSCVADLPDFLRDGDLIVVNDSRVVPARLFGKRGGGDEIELLVVEPSPGSSDVWRCLLKRAKKIRSGEKFFFGMQATATARGRDGTYLLVQFIGRALELAMEHHGVPPLPPYIEREGYEAYTDEDRNRYQTVYADKPGSAAAPTAGLHLSDELLERIGSKVSKVIGITLHVGVDTFTPVRADELEKHRMHGERARIPEEAAYEIVKAKYEGRRVIAVGTTTTRALESATSLEIEGSDGFLSWEEGRLHHGSFTTDLFIKPGYEFEVVDAMLTNFHLPKSTLLMLVSAFAGKEFMLDCYREAIKERYRLFSYGDCMFIT